MSEPSPARYGTTNRSSYNTSLRKRESLLIWVDTEMTGHAPHEGRPKRPSIFANAAVQSYLLIKILFAVLLPQIAGMVASLRLLTGPDWPVPDFSTLGRRHRTPAVQLTYRRTDGPLNLLVDSTGMKFLGDGLRQARTRGTHRWRR